MIQHVNRRRGVRGGEPEPGATIVRGEAFGVDLLAVRGEHHGGGQVEDGSRAQHGDIAWLTKPQIDILLGTRRDATRAVGLRDRLERGVCPGGIGVIRRVVGDSSLSRAVRLHHIDLEIEVAFTIGRERDQLAVG